MIRDVARGGRETWARGVAFPRTRVGVLGLIVMAGGCASQALPPHGAVPPKSGVFYPPAELHAGVGGTATIDCTITKEGRTSDCIIVRDSSPAFGLAALDFVQHVRYSPATHAGVPIDQHHHIWTVNYRP